ncbi:hypothetical protein GGR51DRAFT_517277 [Nemania sp. FL0031]|nr:hypothetical protein GGR51DRAFT_517277 [Nemania sp. FL0031]
MTETGYFKAHGIGTALSDPLKATAIRDVFASKREPNDLVYVYVKPRSIVLISGIQQKDCLFSLKLY